MTFLTKSLLAFATASLLAASTSFAQQAGEAQTPAARLDRLDAELAKARDQLLIAQGYGYGRPPAEMDDGADSPYGRSGQPQDSAGLVLRIDRLENQIRQLNGQIEQMQFATRRLEDQLKKFQSDVDFRFQDQGGRGATPPAPTAGKPPQKRTDAQDILEEPDPQTANLGESEPPAVTPAPARPSRRSDAFDPAVEPNAPGVPRQLGNQTPAAVTGSARTRDDEDPSAPLDLSGSRMRASRDSAALGALAAGSAAPGAVAGVTTPGGTVIAAAPVNPAREEFDLALGYYKQKEYENAEKGFEAFLQKNPKSRMASDAIYYLGESFYQRGRQREAAEQYLKLSTQYASSARAPEAMLRLGQSLNALGAKEQACATFSEVARKYPNASQAVKAGAEREAKRIQC
ncbi:MAG TPA: tol-pal system protein YbgF [Beijerinckia sp.]|nr:tol-pal system protein YbgF [Beijerinckia sp.]